MTGLIYNAHTILAAQVAKTGLNQRVSHRGHA